MSKNQKKDYEAVIIKNHPMDESFKSKLKNNTKGVICHTCGRKAKEYRRRLNAQLCISLIEVLKYYRYSPDVETTDFFNVNELFKQNPILKVDFPKLQYWDLVEAQGVVKGQKFIKKSAMYRISENGIKFAQREVGVPLVAIVYNNIVQGHDLSESATIDKILLDAGYSYDEIIKQGVTFLS